jgi:hypothetical protein
LWGKEFINKIISGLAQNKKSGDVFKSFVLQSQGNFFAIYWSALRFLTLKSWMAYAIFKCHISLSNTKQ